MTTDGERRYAEVRHVNVEQSVQDELRNSIGKVISDLDQIIEDCATQHRWRAQPIQDHAIHVGFTTMVPPGYIAEEGEPIQSMGLSISLSAKIDCSPPSKAR